MASLSVAGASSVFGIAMFNGVVLSVLQPLPAMVAAGATALVVLLAASIAAVAEPGAGMGLSAPPGRGEPLTVRLLRAALRGGFQTSHRCLLVLLVDEGPDKEELLAVLLRSLSLSLAIYQADSAPDCGASPARLAAVELGCQGVLVVSRNYEDGACALQAVYSRLTSSQNVLLLLSEGWTGVNATDTAVQVMGVAGASVLTWSTGELWTLSAAFEAPRRWQRIEDGARAQGREGDDFKGRTLRVATFHQPPFSYIDDPADPRKVFGTEWAVLKLIADHLNFTWSLIISNSSDKWGKPDGKGSWKGGTLGAVVAGRADLAMNVWVQWDQARVVDLTTPTKLTCLTYMVPRPLQLGATGDAVLLPLQTAVWRALLLSILVATLACRLLDAAVQHVGIVTSDSFSTLGRSLHTLLGSAVNTYIPASTASLGPHRHLIAWWVVFSMLITTAFSSGLISHLTLQRSEPPINSAEDIVSRRLSWASNYIPNVHVMLNLETSAERKLADSLRVLDASLWDRSVASGDYVVQGQRLDKYYFLWDGGDLTDQTLDSMRVMQTCFYRYFTSFAFRKDSPLLQPFNRVVLRLAESGVVWYWQQAVLRSRGRKAVSGLLRDAIKHSGPQVIVLSQLWSAFQMLLCGLIVASVVFTVEICSRTSAPKTAVCDDDSK